MYICERPEKMREPLADEFLGRERVTDAKGTRLACDSAVERFENIVEGPSLWGDPKTLTPGPWTPLRTGSMDCFTDRSTDYLYGPPLRTTPKNTELNINNLKKV